MALECSTARASGAVEQVIPTVTIIPIREYLRDPPRPFATEESSSCYPVVLPIRAMKAVINTPLCDITETKICKRDMISIK